jgi:hypothetical protein
VGDVGTNRKEKNMIRILAVALVFGVGCIAVPKAKKLQPKLTVKQFDHSCLKRGSIYSHSDIKVGFGKNCFKQNKNWVVALILRPSPIVKLVFRKMLLKYYGKMPGLVFRFGRKMLVGNTFWVVIIYEAVLSNR